jgi:peptidoglycan/xylan/chitin deacetylase (PgdA/CDA1 family)
MNEALWTLDTNDWKGKSAREIGNIVKKAKNGTIVLMHDDSEVDIDAVPYIADVLTRKGLCTVHLTQGTGEHPFRDGLTFKTVPAGSDRPR